MNFIEKLFIGKSAEKDVTETALYRRLNNIKCIWNNEMHDDVGIERLIRLFLAIAQLFFIGTYVRQLSNKSSKLRDLYIDLLVLIKIIFSFCVVKYNLYNNDIIFFILLWFLVETILYVPTLIFASDYLSRPRSYRRAMLLFFINYIEINISYASIYSKFGELNKIFKHWFDSVYFSFVVSSSIGFGDIYPVSTDAKFILVTHSLISIMFIVLFFNTFSNKMEVTGYFKDN